MFLSCHKKCEVRNRYQTSTCRSQAVVIAAVHVHVHASQDSSVGTACVYGSNPRGVDSAFNPFVSIQCIKINEYHIIL